LWTFSSWVKRGALGANQALFSAGDATVGNTNWIAFLSTDILAFSVADGTYYLASSSVYRDPSAWYHIVVVYDSDNATSSNRMKLYVNGVQLTAFSSSTYPTSGFQGYINNTVAHGISARQRSGFDYYLDGYQTEVNFLDGYAYDPSYFGYSDPTTGVWMPKKYRGAYGTNGFYLPFSLNTASTYAGSFNASSQYITTPTNSNLALGTSDFTVEYWFNPTAMPPASTYCALSSGNGTSTYDGLFGYTSSGTSTIQLYLTSTGSSWDIASGVNIGTGLVAGNWYHVAVTRNGTAFKTFLNGSLTSSFTSAASIYQSANSFVIGRGQSTNYFGGSLSNVRVIKGTALYTASFVPPSSPLTAIANTQLLTLQNSAIIDNSPNAFTLTNSGSVTASAATPFVANIAADLSGNGNSWSPLNINYTTSGVTYDSMLDVPTNWADGGNGRGNYAVLNPLNLWQSSGTTSVVSGNLNQSTSTGSATGGAAATIAISSGKFYWETEFNAIPSSNTCGAGLYDTSVVFGGANSWARSGHWILGDSGLFYANGAAGSASGTGAFSAGNIAMFAFDGSTGKLWVGKNGTWVGTPGTSGEIATLTMSGKSYAPITSTYSTGSIVIANFGQRPFTSTPPSGFKALNTQNLPTPTIAAGNKYMDISLWTGDQNSRTITNSGAFQPDLIWTKSRSDAESHRLHDAVRGGNGTVLYELNSNTTEADGTDTLVSGFASNGFTIAAGANSPNITSRTYIGWQWQAGKGSSSIPSGGTITPTGASINVSAGFSIIAYTGTGSNATVPHGLGATPAFIMIKDRTSATNGGAVYHTNMGATKFLKLFQTTTGSDGEATDNTVWNGGSPTFNSSVFSVGTNVRTNTTDNYIAYIWTPIAGYSSFGGFTANGVSGDGNFIYTGFRPRFILYKRTDTSSSWFIQDTSRQGYNVQGPELYPESNAVEATATRLDILSNGFKVRAPAATNPNVSGATYIYACFAENPFKMALSV
jgi:hypothetical protein